MMALRRSAMGMEMHMFGMCRFSAARLGLPAA